VSNRAEFDEIRDSLRAGLLNQAVEQMRHCDLNAMSTYFYVELNDPDLLYMAVCQWFSSNPHKMPTWRI